MTRAALFFLLVLSGLLANIQAKADGLQLPGPPVSAANPGSKVYSYSVQGAEISCSGRKVNLFVPTGGSGSEVFPVLVYGHGQALSLENYQATLEHLAKKGIVVIFPAYDTGFFDTNWIRMGTDYVNLAACAMASLGKQVTVDQVVFAGHSKGGYVAGVAAGVAFKNKMSIKPKAVILLEPAGADLDSLRFLDPAVSMTVVFSDHDTIVKESIAQSIYSSAPSTIKQFIGLKSYDQTTPTLTADHFWPLTKSSAFGGGSENALHYYGEWKWLTAAALDVAAGAKFNNPYLYGEEALDKGILNFKDSVQRSF